MTHRTRIHLSAVSLLLASLMVTGCGESSTSPSDSASGAATKASWMLQTQPEQALSVTEAKASAEPGDELVMRARIGGRVHPISDESAVFTVMDLAVPHCGQMDMGEHGCPTPWDYCCESPRSKKKNAATVMLVDEQGNTLDVRPVEQGLAPLDEVILVGTVGPRPSQDVLTLRATGVYRVTP